MVNVGLLRTDDPSTPGAAMRRRRPADPAPLRPSEQPDSSPLEPLSQRLAALKRGLRRDGWTAAQQIVIETTAGIATAADLDGAVRIFLSAVRAVTGAESGSLRLLTSSPDAERWTYCIYAWRGGVWQRREEEHEGPGGDAARMLATNRGEYVPDLAALAAKGDAAAAVAVERLGVRSTLKAPLRAGGRVIGVVYADASRPRAFAPALLAPLQLLADSAGAAVEQARLRSESADRLAQLEVAVRVSAAVNAAADLDTMLGKVLEEAVAVAGAHRGTIALVDADRRCVRGRIGFNQPPGMVAATVRQLYAQATPGEDIYAIAVRTGEQLLVGDDHPALHAPTLRRFPRMREQQRVLTPIRHADEVIGVLSVVWDGNSMPSAESRAILWLIAEQAGGAIARERLAEAERRQMKAREAERARSEQLLAWQYQEAETARRETHAILDATSEAVILVAADGRILSANRRLEEFFGLEPDRVIGLNAQEFREEIERIFGDADALARLMERLVDTTNVFRADLHQHAPVARELQVYSGPVHNAEGGFLGRLFAFRDVTQEREIDRMKNEFVSLVSHELRTPLTSIKGYVDLLAAGEVGDLSEGQLDFLQIVKNNADRLVLLINDILDLSRIEAGKVELKLSPLAIADVLRAVADSFQPQLAAKRQTLTLEVAPRLPRVLADADRLTQVFTNLVSNANKYTPAGGRIMVSAAQIGDELAVAVRDSGIGMTPPELAMLFSKFFRSDRRAAREVGGTGLGLTITRSLVELHHGRIEVQSVPDEGSTFRVLLPITLATPGAAPPPPSPLTGTHRVLVVDDEPDIAKLLRRYLERGGFLVQTATSAAAAWRLVQEAPPDLVTLDINLPDADGFTVLEWLKGDSRTADIPVLLLSVAADEGRGALLGAVDFLTKPVQEQVLLARVTQALAERPGHAILVADDDAAVRRVMAGHLRAAGYRVLEAADGAEAVALTRSEHPDLVLLDLRMPNVDGIEALRALSGSSGAPPAPVLLMTACQEALEAYRPVVEALGGYALERKPCTPEELAAVIRRRLG